MTLSRIARGPVGALLWRSQPTYQIFGANTDVGKTIFATILCRAAAKTGTTSYLKPVSTGPDDEADDRHIARYAPGVDRKVLVQYGLAASPHLAAEVAGQEPFSDDQILRSIHKHAAAQLPGSVPNGSPSWMFVETAGGVHSPAPSGTTQADLYAPLRLPVVLVGDAKLGGISQTIMAFESLHMRGYDVASVLMFGDKDRQKSDNYEYLKKYFHSHHNVFVEGVPEPPQRNLDSAEEDQEAMSQYYEEQDANGSSNKILQHLRQLHEERLNQLDTMSTRASNCIWYPFTQQKDLTADKITVVDSAHGSYFQTATNAGVESPALQPSFDASASWWTQGLGHGQPRLALAVAHAAGRYGHVMFAEAVHAPALELAETLLEELQNPRLTRVFFSDNGSTGVEVALKMALRAVRREEEIKNGGKPLEEKKDLEVLSLQGSYHGDTLGAMACSEPNTFNEKTEWYRGKGFWFECPSVQLQQGRWTVQVPAEMETGQGKNASEWDSLSALMDIDSRLGSKLHNLYKEHVTETIRNLLAQGRSFGALLMEPVILGAGGMIFVDPLFQHTLVEVVRHGGLFPGRLTGKSNDDPNSWSGLPVIFDEVFTGLYRLGRFSSASFLQVQPDISVHAKLLTGGVVPLCTTLASESLFGAFASDDKSDALLHGHSYTAHAVGCQTAVESLRMLKALDSNEYEQNGKSGWNWAKKNWQTESRQSSSTPTVWSVWSPEFVTKLSHDDAVQGVWALGSVLAIHLRDAEGSQGYKSNVARALQAGLAQGQRDVGSLQWNVHSRVLGNVLYLMADQMTSAQDIGRLEQLVSSSMK